MTRDSFVDANLNREWASGKPRPGGASWDTRTRPTPATESILAFLQTGLNPRHRSSFSDVRNAVCQSASLGGLAALSLPGLVGGRDSTTAASTRPRFSSRWTTSSSAPPRRSVRKFAALSRATSPSGSKRTTRRSMPADESKCFLIVSWWTSRSTSQSSFSPSSLKRRRGEKDSPLTLEEFNASDPPSTRLTGWPGSEVAGGGCLDPQHKNVNFLRNTISSGKLAVNLNEAVIKLHRINL